jgi:hypothetical protein
VRSLLAEQAWDVTWADDPAGQPRDEPLRDVAGCSGVVTLLSDAVDEEFLDAAGANVRMVANYAVGYDNVDVDAARRRGVGGRLRSCADHAVVPRSIGAMQPRGAARSCRRQRALRPIRNWLPSVSRGGFECRISLALPGSRTRA